MDDQWSRGSDLGKVRNLPFGNIYGPMIQMLVEWQPQGLEELVSSHLCFHDIWFFTVGFIFSGVKMRCTVLHLLYLFCATTRVGLCPKIK